ncbi:hypothetical protein BDN67DRAFT_1073021 [Paxillus ammoniavirescens]|nr:hypothetical protein BDN67DRAFT_1073021 [Paxillus ammoniavirescens]
MYLSSKSRLLLLLSSSVISFSVTGAEAQQTARQNLETENSSKPCRVHAWVRAPDLVPGEIIEGDTRIELEGECPTVERYSFGLTSVTYLRVPLRSIFVAAAIRDNWNVNYRI